MNTRLHSKCRLIRAEKLLRSAQPQYRAPIVFKRSTDFRTAYFRRAWRHAAACAQAEEDNGLRFKPINLDNQDRVLVAEGYDARVLIRWGDPVFEDSPSSIHSTKAKRYKSSSLVIAATMSPTYHCRITVQETLARHCCRPITSTLTSRLCFRNMTFETGRRYRSMPLWPRTAAASSKFGEPPEMVGEIVAGSRFNLRITGETEIEITGPAAGDDFMKVSYDQTGRRVRGMLNNCGGGTTPWGNSSHL